LRVLRALRGGGRTRRRLELGRQLELAARSRERLVVRIRVGPGRDGGGGAPGAPSAPVARSLRRALGRSLHLRHLDSGSCNACDWELTALLNPVYDVRRLGIDFVASPRHADGVVVTGPVTRNLEVAVRRTWEAVPEPKIVVAVGACAASGGIVGESYASAGGVDRVLPSTSSSPAARRGQRLSSSGSWSRGPPRGAGPLSSHFARGRALARPPGVG
jgi:Ni,Fe-hydrogenase III small subunit